MHTSRSQTLLLFGFGGLLLLMFALGGSATLFLRRAAMENERIRLEDADRNRSLERLRSSIFLAGTHVRDYLLDQNNPPSKAHLNGFLGEARTLRESLAKCRRGLPATSFDSEGYLALLSDVFEWPETERVARRYSFAQTILLPRRLQLLAQADQLQTLSERQSEKNSQSVGTLLSTYRTELGILLALTVLLGIFLASTTLRRLLRLEAESNARLDTALRARSEMERLSAELVTAQETERQKISRDLHDEVGQKLYAALLTLGHLRSSVANGERDAAVLQMDKLSEITSQTAAGVRDLALLLRPSMLDDLGLIPALKWLAREATRTRPIPVEVVVDEFTEDLPEELRTCVYRVVQEAVHNAERHSHGRGILVELRQTAAGIDFVIADDGLGFDPVTESGLGLLGMQERVLRFGGTMNIEAAPGRGTRLRFHLPHSHEMSPLRTA